MEVKIYTKQGDARPHFPEPPSVREPDDNPWEVVLFWMLVGWAAFDVAWVVWSVVLA